MKLPNAQLATVPERKVTHYLLNPAHPAGGSVDPARERKRGRRDEGNQSWPALRCRWPVDRARQDKLECSHRMVY